MRGEGGGGERENPVSELMYAKVIAIRVISQIYAKIDPLIDSL